MTETFRSMQTATAARAGRFLILAALLHGCGEAGPDAASDPEDQPAPARAAEIEAGPPAEDAGLAEHARIGPEDIGNTLVAMGAVVGEPLAEGFFLLTEDDQMVFVYSSRRVSSGEGLRVVGPVHGFAPADAAAAADRAFPTGVRAGWSLQLQVSVHATSVSEY
jgi:hypothetical protein